MARLPDFFNIGNREGITPEEILLLMERMYLDIAEQVNSKPDIVQRTVDGVGNETFLAQGTININVSTNKVQMLTNHPTATTVTWTTLS